MVADTVDTLDVVDILKRSIVHMALVYDEYGHLRGSLPVPIFWKPLSAISKPIKGVPSQNWVDGTTFAGSREEAWRHDRPAPSDRRNSGSTARWNDVPRGTMDEVRSYVCLDLPPIDGKADRKIGPPDVIESHDGRAYGANPKRSTSLRATPTL